MILSNDKLKTLIRLLKAGDKQGIKSIILCRLSMEEVCVAMCRNGGPRPDYPDAGNKLKIEQRSGEALIAAFNDVEKKTMQERLWFERRRRLVEYRIGRCYVAFGEQSRPCYYQWIYDSNDNEKLAAYFKGEYPDVDPGGVILEHALTLTPYRRRGIHTLARCRIMELEEKNYGTRRFMSFINPQNKPAMKTALNLGFVPVMVRRERWFLFRHRFVFEDIEWSTES